MVLWYNQETLDTISSHILHSQVLLGETSICLLLKPQI
jgi:hypothetical protein